MSNASQFEKVSTASIFLFSAKIYAVQKLIYFSLSSIFSDDVYLLLIDTRDNNEQRIYVVIIEPEMEDRVIHDRSAVLGEPLNVQIRELLMTDGLEWFRLEKKLFGKLGRLRGFNR